MDKSVMRPPHFECIVGRRILMPDADSDAQSIGQRLDYPLPIPQQKTFSSSIRRIGRSLKECLFDFRFPTDAFRLILRVGRDGVLWDVDGTGWDGMGWDGVRWGG